MADVIAGILQWFSREYFSGEFSGGDLLSLVVLVLLAFALSTRKSQPNNIRTQDVLDLKGDVKSIDGQLSTLIKMLRSTNNGPASGGNRIVHESRNRRRWVWRGTTVDGAERSPGGYRCDASWFPASSTNVISDGMPALQAMGGTCPGGSQT